MLLPAHVKMAVANLKSTKWRSLLTMLGVVVGVASVVTIVSISEGVKQQLAGQVSQAGSQIITVRPGHLSRSRSKGQLISPSLLSSFGGPTFNYADVAVVAKTPGLIGVTPFSLVNGVPNIDSRSYDTSFVVATSDNLSDVLHLKLAYGSFFSDEDTIKDGAVIGSRVAEQLFQENIPIGQSFTIRGQAFRVRGVLDHVLTSPLVPYSNYDDAVIIPADAGKQINGGASNIYQIVARVKDGNQTAAADTINANLRAAHAGQQDFSVYKGSEAFAAASQTLKLLTTFITGIATISLAVGGIGIMNIMLVSVSERTREIGIRKAVGATNRQILLQFLTEALMLSVGGSIIGVGLSFLANYVLRVVTSFQPSINWYVIGIASAVAIVVGTFFGLAPAVKAARKDPIDALRSS